MASNPYDDMSVTGLGGAAQTANPYEQMDITSSSQIKANVVTSMGTNPDVIARQKRLAEYVGYSPAMGNAIPEEVAQMAAIKEVSTNAATSPVLQKRYTDAEFMALGHDDSGALSAIASASEYLWKSGHSGLLSLTGAAATLANNVLGTSEADLATLYKKDPRGLQDMLDNSPATFGIRFARSQQQGSQDVMQSLSPAAQNRYGGLKYSTLEEDKSAWRSPIKIVGDAIQSLPSSLAMGLSMYLTRGAANQASAEALAAGLTPAAARAAGTLAAEQTMARVGAASEGAVGYSQQYNQTREDADKVSEATLNTSDAYKRLLSEGYDAKAARLLVSANAAEQAGQIGGIVDAAVNFVGGKFLGRIIGQGGKPLAAGVKGAATEAATEGIQSPGEQFGQNWAMRNMNPTQDLSDGVLESMLQGLAVGGFSGGAMTAITAASARNDQQTKLAEQAEQHASVLEAMQTTMQASKLLARSPETLTAYAQELVDEGAPNVYLDSAKLVEAGVNLQALAQVMPSLASQLDQAQSGADLVVPTGEFLAGSLTEAGSVFSQPLVEHARTDASGMSRADAKVYMAEKGDALNAEIERVLQEKENDTEFKAGRDQVQAELLTQLNEVKRFTPAVNTQYATLAANFYAVMAARSGMTVQQFAQTYQLGFSGQTQAGAQVLGQPSPEGTALAARMASDPAGVRAQYDSLPGTDGGRILNTDEARELSPEYQADRTKSAHVHEPASQFVKDLYAEKLAGPTPEGRLPVVLFTAGGTGAGKSTMLNSPDGQKLGRDAEIIYDTNMNTLASAVQKIEQALAAKRQVAIFYTYRDPVEALTQGALPRAMRMGRTVPLVEHARTHAGAAKVMRELAVKYADNPNVQIRAYDNSRGKDMGFLSSLDALPEVNENGLTESLYASLQAEHTAGRISDAVFNGTASTSLRLQGVGGRGQQGSDQQSQPQRDGGVRGGPAEGQTGPSGQTLNQSPLQTETPAFKKWFGKSKAVDAAGKPLVVYHGSPDARFVNEDGIFATLKDRMLKFGNTPESKRNADDTRAFFFTTSKAVASSYADDSRAFDYQNADAGVIETYVAVKNPLEFDAEGAHWREAQKQISKDDFIKKAKDQGHDGVVIRNVRDSYDSMTKGRDPVSDVWVAFKPTQIKSAIGNNGNFDGTNPNILNQSAQTNGPFGPVSTAFQHDAQGAVAHLMDAKTGEAIGALHHPDLGDIDLVWGRAGTVEKDYQDGYGLAKIAIKHPEVMNDLQGLLDGMQVVKKGQNRARLESPTHGAVISLDWLGKEKQWMLTEYTKDVDAADTSMGTVSAEVKDSRLDDAHNPIVGADIEKYNQDQRGQIAFANDITQQASIISMFKAADLSTFIHEGGHFFLEVQADLAARIQARISQGETVNDGERSIVDDFNTTLTWMGVKGSPELSGIDTWYLMTADEKRPHHEQWARGFEAYAFEGKSPSIELTTMFQTFRSWLVNVYRTIKDSLIGDTLNVQLTDEVRGVMDRMLATTDQINEAEAARNMGPLFKTAEEAGMTAEQYKAYHDQGVQATLDAIDDLQGKGLRDMQWLQNARSRKLKELQKQHDELRREITMQVRGEVMGQPIYRAWTFLTARAAKPMEPGQAKTEADKEIADHKAKRAEAQEAAAAAEREKLYAANPEVKGLHKGQLVAKNKRQTGINVEQAMLDWDKANPAPAKVTEVEEAADPMFATGKLNTEDLRKTYGKADDAIWRKLSTLRMTSEENGTHPDVVAELFDFSSGDELVQALAEAEPPKSVIEGMTDQRMLEEHGDLATPAGLERAADMAIHNDARVRFIATELATLQKAMSVREKVPGQRNTVDVLARAAKDYASAIIAKLKVRDVRPGQYTAAEVRSAKAAQKAAGDIAQATLHKRNQLINMYAAKAAYAAQEEVKKAITYFKKFDTPSKTLDPQYRMQIEALLERFDLRASTSLKEIDKRKALISWVAELEDEGLAPDIPDSLLQEANRKSFKEMTVEEVRGLRDSIQQIEHLGKLKALLLTAKDNRDFASAVAEIVASIDEHKRDREANTRTSNTNGGKAIEGMKNFWASHIKVATWARIMDGGKDGGPVWEYLLRTANSAGDTEVVMREKATKELAKLVAPVLAQGPIHQRFGKGTFFPSLGRSLNKEAILAMALNLGNASNMQRLLGGEGWNLQQIKPALDTLTAADWNFVQSVWDHFESYRPLIGAKEMRVYGREPVWIDAQPLTVKTSDGQTLSLRGGYYPVKYDPRASGRAEEHQGAEAAKAQMKGAYTSATTRRSFTKERVEEVNGRPLLLSMDGIYNGVQEVIHDLTWHEWLIDANKLLKNKAIDQAIRGTYGPDVMRQFKKWTEDIAAGDSGINSALEAASAFVRQGVSVSGLGLNVMSALMQPLGITQSIVRIGPKWVGRGIAKAIGSPLETTDTVNEKSEFMRTRALTRLREMAEVRTQVKGQSKVRGAVDSSAYFLMMRCQQLVDVPTWWGAYEKAIAEGNGEDRAVALSDQAVIDSQGSGGTKDLSAIERGGAFGKLFTTFYSFFNTALNLGVGKTMTHTDKAKLAADYLLLYAVPVILGAALKDAMTAGDSGDWDDEEHILKKLVGEQISFLLGMVAFARETTGAVQAATGTTQYAGGYGGPAGLRPLGDLVKLGAQVNQGEMDDGLRKAVINTASQLLRLPGAQINRTINGAEALMDGRTSNPGALLTGYQEPH